VRFSCAASLIFERLHAHACYLDTLQLIVNHPLALLIASLTLILKFSDGLTCYEINIVIIGNIFVEFELVCFFRSFDAMLAFSIPH
jgi:hypothetical protein